MSLLRRRAGVRTTAVATGALLLVQLTGAVNIAQASGGTTWTLRSAPGSFWGTGATFAEDTFVVVGNEPRVLTSPDGVTWTSNPAPAGNWTSVVHAQGQFVAVAANSGSGNLAMTSPDGLTWTAQPGLNVTTNWNSVTYGDDTYVASGEQWMAYSTDGVAWTEVNTDGSYHSWKSVAFHDDTFVAVNSFTGGANRVMTSNDGVTWTPRNTGIDVNEWNGVAYGTGLFVAVAGTGTNRVMTSPDGVNWTPGPAASSSYWMAVTYGGGQFVAVGFSGAVMTSPDGITWTAQTSGNSALWRAVAAGPQYVAAGQTTNQPIMSSFIDAAPTVTSISPATGPVSGGTSLTLTGTGLRSGAIVTVGGAACGSVTVVDDTTVTCISPPGSQGLANVNVTNTDSQMGALANGFEFQLPPPVPEPIIAPSPPLSVEAIAGDASAVVTWGASESSGSYRVSTYQVVASPGGRSCLASAPATSCTVTELTNGATYTATVRALSGAGWGAWSLGPAPFTPQAPVRPAVVITGTRGEVTNRAGLVVTGVVVTGVATGMDPGSVLRPWVSLDGDPAFEGTARIPVGEAGDVAWARATRKSATVHLVTESGMRSNSVRIAAAEPERP